jgi:hypothetical protein
MKFQTPNTKQKSHKKKKKTNQQLQKIPLKETTLD